MAEWALSSIEDIRPEMLAEIHAASFTRAWSAADIVNLISTGASGLVLSEARAPVGLLIWRAAADEAEILTIGVHPDHRRRGAGRLLLTSALEALSGKAISRVFLEVAEDNSAAIQLYQTARFSIVGRRKGYYRRDPLTVDAQVLQLKLNTEDH